MLMNTSLESMMLHQKRESEKIEFRFRSFVFKNSTCFLRSNTPFGAVAIG